LLLLVAVTGAGVLALEVLGTRVIGTHYGSSLYVWTALLTVTLACLALGYALGGRLADRVPAPWMLYLIVLLAGGAVWTVPRLVGVLQPLGSTLGLAWGAIASALIIFGVPLTLLAMAGPYVIRLRASRIDGVGSTSGAVYALSTVGSIAGVLMVGLWMIPTLGTRTSLNLCAAVLIGLGAAGAALHIRGKATLLLLLAVLPAAVPAPDHASPEVLFHTESPFGDLQVLQIDRPGRGLHRILTVNGIMQTGMPLDIDLVAAGAILRTDSYYLELLPYYHPDLGAGRHGVLIGLAGGMFPRVMEFYPIDWTAVEIDVKVAEIAKAYFGYRGDICYPDGRRHELDLSRFPRRLSPVMSEHLRNASPEHAAEHADHGPYRGRAVIEDGRRFLQRLREPVDFIVIDAYNADTIPFHLVTREFFELVRSRLTAEGILAVNYIGRPVGDFVTDSLFRTLGAVFGAERLKAYRTRDEASSVQVVFIFAFQRSMALLPLWREGHPSAGVDRLSYELSRRKVDTTPRGGGLITDDLNPMDLARAEAALVWRRQTLALLSPEEGQPDQSP
jgi:spermidine synthase